MKLEGIHHISAITGDAVANVEFYTGVLGLRLVKQTVNQDDPRVYHLFYGDEHGSPGADLTFFEYPHAARGTAGEGMAHRIAWRVGSEAALDFWAARLGERGVPSTRTEHDSLLFSDPEGLAHELALATVADQPLLAVHPEIPAELALQGFDGVRAYSSEPARSERLLRDTLGFSGGEHDRWEARGQRRGGYYAYDPAPATPARMGAGSVHHIAFASEPGEHPAWRERLAQAGFRPTPVIDRFYFKSIYMREPSGVIIELASIGPGFGVDEDPAHLGERLSLPPQYEPLRAELERTLTPLPIARRGIPRA